MRACHINICLTTLGYWNACSFIVENTYALHRAVQADTSVSVYVHVLTADYRTTPTPVDYAATPTPHSDYHLLHLLWSFAQ